MKKVESFHMQMQRQTERERKRESCFFGNKCIRSSCSEGRKAMETVERFACFAVSAGGARGMHLLVGPT